MFNKSGPWSIDWGITLIQEQAYIAFREHDLDILSMCLVAPADTDVYSIPTIWDKPVPDCLGILPYHGARVSLRNNNHQCIQFYCPTVTKFCDRQWRGQLCQNSDIPKKFKVRVSLHKMWRVTDVTFLPNKPIQTPIKSRFRCIQVTGILMGNAHITW